MLKSGTVNDLWDLWIIVETYVSLLKAWYKDPYYYHKIGFLTTELGAAVLVELLSESTKTSKTKFKDYIEKKIQEVVHDKKKPGRRILDYNYKEDGSMLKRVLFLYNVESTYQQRLEFFPFDKYKACDWTLEHIHAQNSERIDHSMKEKWLEWFEENQKVLERLHVRMQDDKNLSELLTNFNKEFE